MVRGHPRRHGHQNVAFGVCVLRYSVGTVLIRSVLAYHHQGFRLHDKRKQSAAVVRHSVCSGYSVYW